MFGCESAGSGEEDGGDCGGGGGAAGGLPSYGGVVAEESGCACPSPRPHAMVWTSQCLAENGGVGQLRI